MKANLEDTIALTWANRAQAELGAKARFKILAAQLTELGASKNIVALVRNAEADEERHAKLCSEVARELGHSTGFAFFEDQTKEVKRAWDNEELASNYLLCEVVLMCCITETINASLLNTIFSSSSGTPLRKIIHEILKDEVKHAQIGWAYLSEESQKKNCGFLDKYLPQMLNLSVKDELFATTGTTVNDQDSFGWGVMPVAQRLNQFNETINKVVFPGFENFGIDVTNAKKWIKDKLDR